MSTSVARMVLKGKIVTMAGRVIDDGRIYIENNRIAKVQASHESSPSGWSDVPKIDAAGVIYPGLIDLHGHLAYNVMPLWKVPQRFQNHRDWMSSSAYQRDIKAPMALLKASGGSSMARALVRYVEVKLLLGGTTVAQGLRSKGGPGDSLYRGLVRNAEAPDEAGLPKAGTRVLNLLKDQIADMRRSLDSGDPYIFHLAEGVDARARQQFQLVQGEGLLRNNLVCIHCLGLAEDDHRILREMGSRTVWSPLSNLLLYGTTLDSTALQTPFALGCDWTPSGSRNLLLELKVASLHANALGWKLSPEALARSVTVDAAAALLWGGHCGQLTEGMLADLLILDDRFPDPFENLLRTTEREVRLVAVGGTPRYGDRRLMADFIEEALLEPLVVGGREKALYLQQADSPLGNLSLERAAEYLRSAMSDLTKPPPALAMMMGGDEPDDFSIELDMQGGSEDGLVELAAVEPITSVSLDPLSVVDDLKFFDVLDQQVNLPDHLKGPRGLREFYL